MEDLIISKYMEPSWAKDLMMKTETKAAEKNQGLIEYLRENDGAEFADILVRMVKAEFDQRKTQSVNL